MYSFHGDLHKFAPYEYVGIYMANMANATFAQLFTPLVCKCGTYHLCHMFTPQYLHICDIFARSKFVQILFSSSELINLFAQLILACLLLNCICVIDLRGTVNGAWSTDGCTLLLINSSRVTCHCNHLTNFALLLRVDSDSVVASEAY